MGVDRATARLPEGQALRQCNSLALVKFSGSLLLLALGRRPRLYQVIIDIANQYVVSQPVDNFSETRSTSDLTHATSPVQTHFLLSWPTWQSAGLRACAGFTSQTATLPPHTVFFKLLTVLLLDPSLQRLLSSRVTDSPRCLSDHISSHTPLPELDPSLQLWGSEDQPGDDAGGIPRWDCR